MRGMYEPVDRRKRAAQYRKNGEECERAGFHFFAEVNYQTATMLDPRDPELDE